MSALDQIWLSKTAFWDIDVDTLDVQKDAFTIIHHVANNGLREDYRKIFTFYGEEKIKENLLQASYLKNTVLNFFSQYFILDPSQFSCYRRKQLHPQLWNY